MGKPRKRLAKNKNYNYDINRRKLWAKRKKMPTIECTEIAEAWDRRKSVLKNLTDMGLSYDPNKTLCIKKTKEFLGPKFKEDEMEVEEEARPSKEHVIKALEVEASKPAAKTNKLSEPDVQYCTYMIDKYGDDYKAMSRDPKNYYQDTPKQIKKKIYMFKNNTEQYEAYLQSKSEMG
ncbi:Nucleolar protein 16 [Mactra antiquata]